MTTLNDTFEIECAQEDEGYDSEVESLNFPTLLRRALQICHISTSRIYPSILQYHSPLLNNTQ